jgi:hypothetical protein
MNKLLGAILLVLMVFTMSNVAEAQDLSFADVEVNGASVLDGRTLYVERGDTLNVRVTLMANTNLDDLRVKASIGGYEYGDVEQDSEIIKLDSGTTRVVSLRIQIPEDIDASDDKNLKIEASNDDMEIEDFFTIRIQEKRHFVNLYDVFVNPGLTVRDYLSVSVVLENLGDCLDVDDCEPERNIIVEAALPQLGMSVRDSVDKLYPDNLEDDSDDSARDSTAKVNLPVMDLNNVPAGSYDLVVRAYYNRNHDFSERKYTLVVDKGAVQNLILNADSTSKDIVSKSKVTYLVNIANLGNQDRSFLVNVEGVSSFGSVSVEPRTVTVGAGSTQDVLVTIDTNDKLVEGSNLFVVKLMENGQQVSELNLEARSARDGSTDSFKLGLQIAFVVLLVILIVLGIIVAVTRDKDDGDNMSEPEVPQAPSNDEEGQQTYY